MPFFKMANTTGQYNHLVLNQGEILMVLVSRSKLSAAELAEKMGYTRTYLPKLYPLEKLKPRQIMAACAALDVSPDIFTNNLDLRLSQMEKEMVELAKKNTDLENRVRILEAENTGLRLAINN